MNLYNKKELLIILFVALAYLISAKIVSPLSLSQTSSVFVLWPPTGIALASLIIYGYRVTLGIFFGAFLLNYSITPFLVSFEIAISNTIGPIIAFYFIKKHILDYKIFGNYKYLFIFFINIILASLFTSSIGTYFLLLNNIISEDIYFKVFFSWFNGDLIGFIIITPLIINLFKLNNFEININEIIELLLVSFLLFFFLWLVFEDNGLISEELYSLEILFILPLLWFTIRFKTLGTTISLLILSTMITIGTINNNGPFVREDIDLSLFLLQNFILVFTFTFFIILVMLNTNDKNRKKLQSLTDKLLTAQKIAKISNWEYDINNNSLELSEESLNIFETKDKRLNLDFLEEFLSKKDFRKLKNYILNIKERNKSITFKLNINNSIKWLIFNSSLDINKNILIGTIQDITIQKEKERENINKERIFSQQAKMASMGEMIENIAHQWRQPLSTISTSATGLLLQKDLDILSDETMVESLKRINHTTQFLSTTIDDFRNFFKLEKEKTTFLFNELFDKTLRIVYTQADNSNITFIKNINDIKITSYENELMQVIINLLNNAKDALIGNKINNKLIFIDCYKKGNKTVIGIKDNAGGVANNIIDKIFEPYFTTKYKSNGTGIGLYMSHEIISKHMKGNLNVENIEFKYKEVSYIGAYFKIELYDN
jgi:signal transduction histidine kinase